MPISPPLLAGCAAYRRGDWAAARIAWEAAASEHPDELAVGLARLAKALDDAAAGEGAAAATRYAEACRLLALPAATAGGIDVERLRRSLPADVAAALAAPPAVLPADRIPWRLYLRFALLLAILGAGFIVLHWARLQGYLSEEWIVGLLADLRESWWSPLALLALFLLLCPLGIPASPMIIGGGVVFGPLWGGIYNCVGVILAAIESFLLARLLGSDLVAHLVGAERLARAERIVARHGFWALVRLRFVPLPFPLVNYGAALAGVPLPMFAASSVVGLAPAVLVYTYFSSALFRAAAGGRGSILRNMGIAIALLLALTFAPPLVRALRRRRRLARLRRARRARDRTEERGDER